MTTTLPLRIWLAAALLCGTVPLHSDGDAQATRGARLVAVGDIHGELDGFVSILRAAGLVDAQRRWAGGKARLVQTGDFLDRGAAVREVMDLLMRLEEESRRAGGRVDVLFGNHEAMNVLHDLRDVSPAAFASFADGSSESRRSRAFDAAAAAATRNGRELDRDAWMQSRPPGFVEYLDAVGPSGRYGRGLRTRKVALQGDGSIFMHAGFPVTSAATVEEINRTAEREVRTFDNARAALQRAGRLGPASSLQEIVDAASGELNRIAIMLRDKVELPPEVTQEYVTRLQGLLPLNTWSLLAPQGPLWYRGYAALTDAAAGDVQAALRQRGAGRLVIGHTPMAAGRITPRFDGRVFLIDTGMLSSHYKGGRPSALEIDGERVSAIYADSREELSGPAKVAAARSKRSSVTDAPAARPTSVHRSVRSAAATIPPN